MTVVSPEHQEHGKGRAIISLLKNPAEFVLSLRITFFLSVLPLMLKIFSVRSIVHRITPRRERCISTRLTIGRVVYLCEGILDYMQRFGYRFSCLRRSLLLYRFMRYYGEPVVINFGVKWEADQLMGHSWLTLEGKTFREPPGKVEQFTHFFSIPLTGTGSPGEGASQTELEQLNTLPFD
ncbi:MAG: lasso peptide biosynthesis B2 protein [bacterium]|nr:MAG: lasso peptide biosynthesis B2 protein [bacterium]